MCHALSDWLPLYIVAEYPKSGGTWIAQMLAAYLDIPFPRNRRPSLTSSVMHGHMLYSPLMKNAVCVFRDGRDVMVSAYYHMLFQNERNSPMLVERTRAALGPADFDDVRSTLPRFIAQMVASEERSLSPFRFTWGEFVRSWLRPGTLQVRYEDMVADPMRTFGNMVEGLGVGPVDPVRIAAVVEEFSFQRQAGRAAGEEKQGSFLRRGKPGGWTNKFSREAGELFHRLAGPEMIALGYVQDASWVDDLTP